MLTIGRPSESRLRRFIDKQAAQPFTYAAVGATAGTLPAGFAGFHGRTELGRGEARFNSAKAALDRWAQLRLGWLEVGFRETPLRAGEVVATGVRLFGIWSINACRIVYVVDEAGPVARYGLAYGTLPDHVAVGEERFLVEWNRAEDTVWFDIRVFSRPRHWLAWPGYPVLWLVQRRFRRQSPLAMLRAVEAAR